MRIRLFNMALATLVVMELGTTVTATADDYVIDAVHSSVTFKISHLGVGWVHGRFNDFAGKFTIDSSDPAKSSFTLNINPASVDTNNSGRDGHLKAPDFFNVKQFPVLSFTSAAVKPIEGGLEVTGDLTLHGEIKPVTFTLKGGNKAEFPKGVQRTGYSTDLVLKRTEFGVGKPTPALGDEVHISISFEGTKK